MLVSPRRIIPLFALSLVLPLVGGWAAPAGAATLPAPLTGHLVGPDGTPIAGAQVTLQVESDQLIAGGTGTDGRLLGVGTTDASGMWRIIPNWPGVWAVPNPDGSVMVDAEATSSDGTWDKLFNFNVMQPTSDGQSATVPDAADSDTVQGSQGGAVTGINLSYAGVQQAPPEQPNTLTPVETDIAGTSAYDVAAADDGDETGANAGRSPTKTCDTLHHVCYITGNPGPCKSSEPVSGWRDMPGDANTEKRWIPVQEIATTGEGHEHYTFQNGKTTQMSVAYGGAGSNYAGSLTYSRQNSTEGGNDASAGTYFNGYFKQQWVFRKQRQWCVGDDVSKPGYNDLRDSGRRRFIPDAWLGGLTRQSATLQAQSCHDAYALKVFTGQTPWVTRTSVVSWEGYFSLFGVSLKSKTEDNSSHTLELSADDTTKFCPDSSQSVFAANRVEEE